MLSNTLPFGSYDRLETSSWLPLWLQAAGYRTAHLGKFLNGYDVDPTEIRRAGTSGATTGRETYRYWGYKVNENGRLETYGSDRDPDLYATDFMSRRATELIEDLAPSDVPFFLSVGFLAPHTGGPAEPGDPPGVATPAVAPRHRGAFAGAPLPRPPGFSERNVADKPPRIKRLPRLTPARIALIRQKYEQRLESLLAVDDGVDEIIDALRQAGELENTLVIFTSDNGFFHGEHRIWSGKAQVYEPAIRVPLLMRGPGSRRDAGRTASSATSTSRRRSSRRPASRRGRSSTDARCCRWPAERAALARLPAARGRRPARARLRRHPHPALRLRGAPRRAARALRPPSRPVPAAQRAQVARLCGGARGAEARLANLRICAGARLRRPRKTPRAGLVPRP